MSRAEGHWFHGWAVAAVIALIALLGTAIHFSGQDFADHWVAFSGETALFLGCIGVGIWPQVMKGAPP